MKNKHLVGLFLGILLFGVLGRYCDFRCGTKLDAVLFKKPLAELDKIYIYDNDTLVTSRAAELWLMTRRDETVVVQDSLILRLLNAIQQIETTQLLHSTRPDTLGLLPEQRLTVVCSSSQWQDQVFFLGREIVQNNLPFTWLALPNHAQYYLIKGHLRKAFFVNFDQLTPPLPMQIDTANMAGLAFFYQSDTLFNLFCDPKLNYWSNTSDIQRDTSLPRKLENWKIRWEAIADEAKIADYFDKRSAPETFCGEIRFRYQQTTNTSVNYRLFFIQQPVLPDDPEKRRYFRNFKPQYLFESDLQPGLYFAIKDTSVIHSLKHL
ncbi:MAG: hypothetical protein RIR11_1927 [Bacteroidota bacterium]|jgi:hypothetical protein